MEKWFAVKFSIWSEMLQYSSKQHIYLFTRSLFKSNDIEIIFYFLNVINYCNTYTVRLENTKRAISIAIVCPFTKCHTKCTVFDWFIHSLATLAGWIIADQCISLVFLINYLAWQYGYQFLINLLFELQTYYMNCCTIHTYSSTRNTYSEFGKWCKSFQTFLFICHQETLKEMLAFYLSRHELNIGIHSFRIRFCKIQMK